MKRYIKEIIIFLIQLFMFYIFPLFAGPTDVIAMVILIIFATFLLSLLLGILSDKIIKFFYPIATSIVFIPTIFIYYNESASIHAVWYLVVSLTGLLPGTLIHIIYEHFKKK